MLPVDIKMPRVMKYRSDIRLKLLTALNIISSLGCKYKLIRINSAVQIGQNVYEFNIVAEKEEDQVSMIFLGFCRCPIRGKTSKRTTVENYRLIYIEEENGSSVPQIILEPEI